MPASDAVGRRSVPWFFILLPTFYCLFCFLCVRELADDLAEIAVGVEAVVGFELGGKCPFPKETFKPIHPV